MPAEILKTKARAMLEQLASSGIEVWRKAYNQGHSLSVMMEMEDPSSDYPDEKTDAFQRVMREANIRTRSLPELGIRADEMGAFGKVEGAKYLVPEFLTRAYKSARYGKPPSTRALYMDNDSSVGSIQNPFIDAPDARWSHLLAAQIPIERLVARTTPIDGTNYRAFYLQEDAANERMVRVAQGAEIPGAKLVEGERGIKLYKYGRKLTMIYEQLRHVRVDTVAFTVARMAIRAEVDKLATVISVLINGDGNAGTAAEVVGLSTVDTAAAGQLTLKAWQNYKKRFDNPYFLDTALAQADLITAMELLTTGNANIPLIAVAPTFNLNTFRPINNQLRDSIAVGWTSEAPANKVVGFDSRLAVEQVIEIGATISEVERFVTNQTEALVMTETEGYAILDSNATKILDLAA